MHALLKSNRWEGAASPGLAPVWLLVTLMPASRVFSPRTVSLTLMWICSVVLTPMFGLSAVRRGNRLNRICGWAALVTYGLSLLALYSLLLAR